MSVRSVIDFQAWRARRQAVPPRVRCRPCVMCGMLLTVVDGDLPICSQHTVEGGSNFDARTNRIWCDFFHRQVPIQRIDQRERDFQDDDPEPAA